MMKFFSSWAEQIIIAVVITSIIEMILPDNKNKKYIKMIMGIYILFNIISPIVNKKDLLNFDEFNLESYATSSENNEVEKVNQQSMDDRLQQLYIEELQNNIKAKVQEEGYQVKSCKVDAVLTGDESKQGINKISLVVSSSNNLTDEDKDVSKDSNIKAVNKVEVKVGLDRFWDKDSDEDESTTNSDLLGLKNSLSEYYGVSVDKIQINIIH